MDMAESGGRDDKRETREPVINFNLPGFLAVVKQKGAEKATIEALEDLLVMTYKALRGRK